MEKKKENRTWIIIIAGILVYLICSLVQSKLARPASAGGGAPKTGNNPMAGVISQIQVVVTVVLVLFAQKKGYITALILNGFNTLFTLIVQMIIPHSTKAIPGLVVTLISMGIATVIYFYTSKTERMNEELEKSYHEAIEKNRIIEQQGEAMKFLAYNDKLTGMPNRESFMNNLEKQIKESGDCVMIYIDLDDFRRINDNFGHVIGDELLKQYSDKIQNYCGDKAYAAKIGGDEFGIVLGSGMTNEAIFKYAAGISGIFSEPINIGGNIYTVAASYGAASFPENAMTADDLFRNAETAMFNAKESGKNQLCFFTQQG
ncbi:GGDEF domain-containing protein [Ruminococcus albus]|uniref:Diguanylate cyclase (GGDEF) domain-containing protein n=1 Tax=Ruminococcus albus TaxID=1264 RepID=A0A1I1NTT4_RUMAL|nr:GGDEF domain-containing protein [Ruminococcus albus]SFD00845.1 diguanylate cyclase (GGDEF) domain-containing protein [Ruminococcus albus]